MRVDASHNRLELVKACRDVVAARGSVSVTAKEIASKAGVSSATLFRHFDSKEALIDEVSVMRWVQMERYSRLGVLPGRSSLHQVVGILGAFTRMINTDGAFIDATGLRIGHSPQAIMPLRGAFEPNFADLWLDCQRQEQIRKASHPRDAIDMAGAIRNKNRRLQMLTTLVSGICTDAVDHEALLSELFLKGTARTYTGVRSSAAA